MEVKSSISGSGDATYPNQGFVADPILYITDSAGKIIATVDDWASGPTDLDNTSYYQTGYLSELQNSKYAMNGTKEAAIIMIYLSELTLLLSEQK